MLSLSSRQSFILNRVVDTFIETGHPVSSKTVAYASPSPVSSATIRHEMGTLEETGYLVQAHHSSGRIPTDQGYRHYLDHGIESYEMRIDHMRELSGRFSDRFKSPEDTAAFSEEFASTLSALSKQLGVLLVPDAGSMDLDAGRVQMTAQGLRYLLDNPECQDSATIRPLIRAVEEKETLKRWIGEHAPCLKPQAFIGLEHAFEDLEDYTIVTARFESGENGPSGVVAVIGLKRMAYAKVLPIVSGMAKLMGTTFQVMRQDGRRNPN